MNEWSSYDLQGFIPFSRDIYFRLLERIGETFWPLHLLTLALGAAALLLALKTRGRLACWLIAPLWAFVGVAFFIQRYAQLNWAGGYVGYVFLAEAVLLLLIGFTGGGLNNLRRWNKPAVPKGFAIIGLNILGGAIAVTGLVGLPLIAPLTGGSWHQAEVFGIYADPTAVTTLGLLLIMLRGWLLWLAAIMPALWLLLSALTLLVLEAPGANVLFALLAIGLVGLVWKSVASTKSV